MLAVLCFRISLFPMFLKLSFGVLFLWHQLASPRVAAVYQGILFIAANQYFFVSSSCSPSSQPSRFDIIIYFCLCHLNTPSLFAGLSSGFPVYKLSHHNLVLISSPLKYCLERISTDIHGIGILDCGVSDIVRLINILPSLTSPSNITLLFRWRNCNNLIW